MDLPGEGIFRNNSPHSILSSFPVNIPFLDSFLPSGRFPSGPATLTHNSHPKRRNVMTKLAEIEGVGEAYAKKLGALGISTTEALLDKGASPKGRKEIAEKSGISEKLVLKWLNRADLARVKGIGGEYADLLEAAGVDTVPGLAQRNGANLHGKLVEVNEAKKLVRKVPAESQVTDWIDQAKKLPRVLSY
jgi:predicted flap endonuclease-1-like 5' DNA nuclease